jgi:uncharacterized membrane protein
VKQFRQSVVQALIAGIVIVVPIYLAILLLLKAMKSVGTLVRPLARLLPHSIPGETLISFLAVLALCFFVGIGVRTRFGLAARNRIETSVLQKIPGYQVMRSMTQQLAGQGQDSTWQPALVEIEEALVPAFIVEKLEDGRFTIFVPSVPTPLAGTVYIIRPERVYPLHVPFSEAVKVITRWGAGSKDLVAAVQKRPRPSAVTV